MPPSKEEIVRAFRALDMGVTDDFDKVKESREQHATYWSREVRNTTDNVFRARLEEKLQITQPLSERKRFDEYILTLQRMFIDIAKAMTASDDHLIKIAIDQFNFCEEFARKTVEAWRKDQHRVTPSLVSNLKAYVRPNQVDLSWIRPSERFDNLSLYREEIGNDNAQEPLVENIIRDDYSDKRVGPGKRYKYKIYSFHQGFCSPKAMEIEIRTPEEAKEVSGFWKAIEGSPVIELKFKAPPNCSKLAIFRKAGSRPIISDDLQPGDTETVFFEINPEKESYNDEKVEAGSYYHYLVIAIFADNVRADGVNCSVALPPVPSPVSRVQAVYNPKENLTTINWQPLDTQVCYSVVRKEGSLPPSGPTDGEIITSDSKQTKFVDDRVQPGLVYTYSVFTSSKGLLNRVGTSSEQVIALAEVTELKYTSGDREVNLSWKPHNNAEDVRVLRSTDPASPMGPRDPLAFRVPCSMDRAHDTGLINDTRYNYRVCCGYRLASGNLEYSGGIVLRSIIPRQAPPPILNLIPVVMSDHVELKHEEVRDAEVIIYRFSEPPQMHTGDVVKISDIQHWQEPIQSNGRRGVDESPQPEERYYLPIAKRGSQATIGQIRRLPIPNISELESFLVRDGVILSWKWPPECKSVRVVRRLGDKPSGPQDQNALYWEVTRDNYDLDSERFMDEMDETTLDHDEEAHYVVYAKFGREFADGTTRGSFCSVPLKRLPLVEYQLRRTWLGLRVKWRIDADLRFFNGFTIRYDWNDYPRNINDGEELVRYVPDRSNNGNLSDWQKKEVRITRQRGSIYCRLFLLNRADYQSLTIVHPPMGVTPSFGRRFLSLRKSRETNALKKQRGSRVVVCPHCFERFPVYELLFRFMPEEKDNNSSETYPLPHKWWVKLNPFYRLRTRFPKGPNRKIFEEKICPKCLDNPKKNKWQRALPQTAGCQRSLIIGLIGGRSVGKTHYVVSLISRLERLDKMFTIGHLDEITKTRFGELERRLFGEKTNLTPTQVEEPALIYRLTPIESDRAPCTLALYDTAGEFFASQADVAQRTAYLKEADGLLFMVDPEQCEGMMQMLHGRLVGQSANQVLDEVTNLLRIKMDLPKNLKIRTPLAVVFTKADVLSKAQLIDPQSLWHKPISHEKSYDLHLHHEVDSIIGDLMKQQEVKVFSAVTGSYQNYAFFAVSATSSEVSVDGTYPKVIPKRVEDPLLWLLYRLGAIRGQ